MRSFNELTEILAGIYDTRGARGDMAQHYLHKYVNSCSGEFVSLHMRLNTSQFPLNWVLSNTAVNRLHTTINQIIADSSVDEPELRKLFVYKSTLRKPGKLQNIVSASHVSNNLVASH